MEYVKSYIRVFGFIAFEGDSGARTWCIDFCLLPKCLTKKIQGSLHPRNSTKIGGSPFFQHRNHFGYIHSSDLKEKSATTWRFHPRYRKWLGSPPFISHETAICEGSHNPILRGLTNDHHGLLTTYPSVMGPDPPWPPRLVVVLLNFIAYLELAALDRRSRACWGIFNHWKKHVGFTGGFPAESCWNFVGTFSTFFWDGDGIHRKYERKSVEIPFSGCNSEGKNFWSWIDSRFGAPVAMILGKQLPSRRRAFCFRFKKVELNDEKLWGCWNNGEPIFVKMLICRLRCKVSFHHCYTLVPLIHLWMFYSKRFFSSYWWILVEVHQEILTFSKESMEVESPKSSSWIMAGCENPFLELWQEMFCFYIDLYMSNIWTFLEENTHAIQHSYSFFQSKLYQLLLNILLMEEIPNNHLENSQTLYSEYILGFQLPFPQLVSESRISGCHQQYCYQLIAAWGSEAGGSAPSWSLWVDTGEYLPEGSSGWLVRLPNWGNFRKWWYPQSPPQVLIIFSGKTHGFVGETQHFRKPPTISHTKRGCNLI